MPITITYCDYLYVASLFVMLIMAVTKSFFINTWFGIYIGVISLAGVLLPIVDRRPEQIQDEYENLSDSSMSSLNSLNSLSSNNSFNSFNSIENSEDDIVII